MDIDDLMVDAYRHCISRNMPLSEELIEWFDGKVDEDQHHANVAGCDYPRLESIISIVSRFGLSYSPPAWHEVLAKKDQANA